MCNDGCMCINSRGRASANAFASNKQSCPDKEDLKWEFTTGNGLEDAGDLSLICVSEGIFSAR